VERARSAWKRRVFQHMLNQSQTPNPSNLPLLAAPPPSGPTLTPPFPKQESPHLSREGTRVAGLAADPPQIFDAVVPKVNSWGIGAITSSQFPRGRPLVRGVAEKGGAQLWGQSRVGWPPHTGLHPQDGSECICEPSQMVKRKGL